MNLQSLSAIVKKDGYLSLNASTNQIEIKGTNFLSRMVMWIRYKISDRYRGEVARAREPLREAMRQDEIYKKDFELNIMDGGLFFLEEDKPISSRQIRLFINGVRAQADRFISVENVRKQQKLETAKAWIANLSAYDGDEIAREALDKQLDVMITDKVAAMPGVEEADLNRAAIVDELYHTTIADQDGVAVIENEEQAKALVDRVLVSVVDRHIIEAQKDRQATLIERLATVNLPQPMRQVLESEISASHIIGAQQLDSRVNDLILEDTAKKFDHLLSEAAQTSGLDIALLRNLNLRKYLRNYLPRSGERLLSIDSAPRLVVELLIEKGRTKKDSVEAWISKFSGGDGTPAHRDLFKSRVNELFKAKVANHPELHTNNVRLYDIDDEIRQTAQAAFDNLVALDTEEQAYQLMDTFVSDAIDGRITRTRVQIQQRLKEELSEINLTQTTRTEIEAEIDSTKIASQYQLKHRIIGLVLEKIDKDFDALASEAAKKYRFNKELIGGDRGKEQLMQSLKARLMKSSGYKELFAMSTHSEVLQQLNRQKSDLVSGWVKQCSGAGDAESVSLFKNELDRMLASEMSALPGITAEEVQTEGLAEQIQQAILNDPQDVAAIENESDARRMVLDKMSAFVKLRVEQTLLQSQQKLYERLADAHLPDTDHRALETDITELRITNVSSLNRAIRNVIAGRIDTEFDTLFKQVAKDYNFNEEIASLPAIREQMREQIVTRGPLSAPAARTYARELLTQWLATKIEALGAIEQSRFSGTEATLKELVLQEPYTSKHQVREFQRVIEKTWGEIYDSNTETYDALGMNVNNMLAQLQKMKHGDTLLNNLKILVRDAPKPASAFESSTWQATGIEAALRDYAQSSTDALVNTYQRVEQLRGQVSDSVYLGARRSVIEQGATWGENFVGSVNARYTDTLKADHYAALYRLLESPVVAQQALGTGPNGIPFTFGDLVESTIARKRDINKEKKRHQAVDKLMPAEQKDYLLTNIAADLSKVRNQVLDSGTANDLFQRSALNFLRNAKIDFANKKIEFTRPSVPPPPPSYETTV